MEMRQVVRIVNLHEHPNDNAEETTQLRHCSIVPAQERL
jgi:hypothetical protein